MRLIVEVFGHAVMLTLQGAKIADGSKASSQEEFEYVPVDPHSVGGGQVERGEGVSASCHATDPVARKFGFRGSQG